MPRSIILDGEVYLEKSDITVSLDDSGKKTTMENYWVTSVMGDGMVEVTLLDLNDEKTRLDMAKWLSETICEFRFDGDVGHGVFEYGLSKKHHKYGKTF